MCGTNDFVRIFCGTSKRKQDLGWTLGMGQVDWSNNVNMAIREFVANAIDRTVKQGDSVRDAPWVG